MTEDEQQTNGIVDQLRRIADALERQVDLLQSEHEERARQLAEEQALRDAKKARSLKTFERQLKQLAEVDRLARDLKTKLQAKRAEAEQSAEETVSSESPSETASPQKGNK